MIPIEQNKIENYIADYYRSYFQMDSVYNDWALVNKIQDSTLFVLDELNKQQPTSQSSLKRRLGYSKQTISSSLRRLEADGLIVRQRAEGDRRNKLIYLTPRSKEYAGALLARLHAAESRAFQTLGEEERRRVLDAFHKLTAALAASIRADIETNAVDMPVSSIDKEVGFSI